MYVRQDPFMSVYVSCMGHEIMIPLDFLKIQEAHSLADEHPYLVVHPRVITPLITGISRVSPFPTGVITHLVSGMNHQVVDHSAYF